MPTKHLHISSNFLSQKYCLSSRTSQALASQALASQPLKSQALASQAVGTTQWVVSDY